MSDLIVLVPTRGRPSNLWSLWKAFEETCTSGTVLAACVDVDDPQLDAYQAVVSEVTASRGFDVDLSGDDWLTRTVPEPWMLLITGPRRRLAGTLDETARMFAPAVPRLAFMGDDHRPLTVGWDARYIAELDRLGTGLVYGDDLIQGPNLPTQVAMTSDIVLATGHMVPPGLVHLWVDNAWLELGRALGAITYLPDVVVEHCHPIAQKAMWDQGYAECNSDQLMDADRAVFEAWRANDLDRWVQQIKEYQR